MKNKNCYGLIIQIFKDQEEVAYIKHLTDQKKTRIEMVSVLENILEQLSDNEVFEVIFEDENRYKIYYEDGGYMGDIIVDFEDEI